VTSGTDDDDPLQEAKAYGNSIYLMAGMPYLLLGGVSVLVYRRFKNKSHPVP
jgi:LPXTG-motif cell wall-anchored protein